MTTATTTPTAATAPVRRADCEDPTHRRRAYARARRCTTCRKGPTGYGSPKDGVSACLGCGTLIGYYSCAPGSCVACAHDPCWVPVR